MHVAKDKSFRGAPFAMFFRGGSGGLPPTPEIFDIAGQYFVGGI